MAKEKQNTVALAEAIIAPVLAELGLELWDVRFEKEGSQWYLRYFIDKDGVVSINDLEAVSREIGPLLDAADPIQQSYTLECCSPGVDRRLTRDEHFARYIGSDVDVRLIRPVDGVRDFTGELVSKDGDTVTILLEDDIAMSFTESEAAFVKLYVDFNVGGC